MRKNQELTRSTRSSSQNQECQVLAHRNPHHRTNPGAAWLCVSGMRNLPLGLFSKAQSRYQLDFRLQQQCLPRVACSVLIVGSCLCLCLV